MRLKIEVGRPQANGERVLVTLSMGPDEGKGDLAQIGQLIPSVAEWELLRSALDLRSRTARAPDYPSEVLHLEVIQAEEE